jgi:hypothetical protein
MTQARSSLPGGRPWVELPRFLVRSFQFSLGMYPPFSMKDTSPSSTATLAHHPLRVAGLRVKSTPLTTMPHTTPMAGQTKRE